MTQVVYADILVIVNIYVNYALICLSAVICRHKSKRLRLVLSAVLGGFGSLIILVPDIPDLLFVLIRLLFAVLLVFTAFGYENKRQFLRAFGSFFLVNFVFAGIMLALWLFASPKAMLYSGGIVYFNINTLTLAVLTVICYIVMKLIHTFIEFKMPKNTVYELEIFGFHDVFSLRAFLDTGNSVTEPFSSLPVIIAYGGIKGKSGKTLAESVSESQINMRVIPCSLIGSGTVLEGFMPESIHIKGISAEFDASRLYIAVTDKKIKNGEYGAILNPAVFENKTNETEEDYVKKT